MNPLAKLPEAKLLRFCRHGACVLAQCIHQHNFSMVAISCPALFHRALSCKIGKSSAISLVSSLMAMVIEAFGVFSYLVKHLQCLFGLIYDFWDVFVISCFESVGCTLGSIYTIRVACKKYTTQ